MSVDIFAPTLLADITAPKHWDTKFLFAHLSQRFDYIVQLSEAGPLRWVVAVWWRPDRPRPDEVGITGRLGSLGWTDTDVSLDQACALVREASAALAARSAPYIVAFYPGDWWRAQARHARADEGRRLGGAA